MTIIGGVMSASEHLQKGFQDGSDERRMFPRIQASCPVRYSTQNNEEWGNAELHNYSAIGVCIVSDVTLLQSSKIQLELMPEKRSRVPSITAEAIVVRCGLRDDHRYEIACKLTKVKRRRDSSGSIVNGV